MRLVEFFNLQEDEADLRVSDVNPDQDSTAKEDLYFNALGRLAYVTRKSQEQGEDEEDQAYWRERRRALSKVVNRLAKSFNLKSVGDIAKDRRLASTADSVD